jgi:hypothetical protein
MPASDHSVKHAIETWPPIAALPLRDLYTAAEPARVRLWAACDLLEMLARLMVVLGIAELAAVGAGRLPPDLLRELFGLIEEPTLGAWQGMAEAVARRVKGTKAPLFEDAAAMGEGVRSPRRGRSANSWARMSLAVIFGNFSKASVKASAPRLCNTNSEPNGVGRAEESYRHAPAPAARTRRGPASSGIRRDHRADRRATRSCGRAGPCRAPPGRGRH